jgi:hypothetical protein
MDKSKSNNKKEIPSFSELKEGVHYYYEKGLLVFTETYHLLRGHCCGSGCRHCAYRMKNEE